MRVSLDGVDFKIREPIPFDRKWFSHKFHGPGLRYEVGLSIANNEVVWASGGYPCGEYPDLKMARALYCHYAKRDITLADKGYRDAHFFKQPTTIGEKRILARHETFNSRLKSFEALNSRFRNNIGKHPMVFHAVINILQMSISNGEFHWE